MNEEQSKMAAVFNEWARQYAENPSAFRDMLDKDGKPIEDYGQGCVATYEKIHKQLFPEA